MASNTSAATYKYQFVSEPDDALKCPICLEVAEEPWQHGECGKLFCKKCLEQQGEDKPCPNCKSEQPKYFIDSMSKKEISDLHVKCENIERKCEWVGTVGTLEEHVATCEFTLLPCPKECKDDDKDVKCFMSQDLDEHLNESCPNRDHTCERCGEEGTYAHITEIHTKACDKDIPSPDDGYTLQHQHIQKDADTESAIVSCKYSTIGCEKELKRRDMAAHEEDKEFHLQIALNEINLLQERCITLKSGESINFMITDYQNAKNHNKSEISPSYYISPNGYRMAIEVYANGYGDGEGTHVSVSTPVLKGRYDDELEWPFTRNITITLLNQLEDINHHCLAMDVTPEYNAQAGGNALGIIKFIPHSELGHDPVKNTQYLKDDTLYFRMSVEVADHKPWLE